ncbi:MAG: hypothetical protein JWQ39_2645 [Glaciihabitans sp.]|nr:hypothetical protein [Glaciihabitans sp.]
MTEQLAPSTTVPLSAPFYGASLPVAVGRYWRKYATFSGRASRSEFWWWALVQFIIVAILLAIYIPSLLAGRTGGNGIRIDAGIIVVIVVGGIWGLVNIVPGIALTWRRLHDANLSGLFWLLSFIPSLGGLIMLVLTLLPSNPKGARFDAPRA